METMSFGMMIVCLLVDLYCDNYVDYSYLIRQMLEVSTLINIPGLHYLWLHKISQVFQLLILHLHWSCSNSNRVYFIC